MATITDTTATEPAFVVERFNVSDGRVEVAGHWRHVRGRRFVRPVLWLQKGESRQRLMAVLDHKPWAADDGEPWLAAFKWEGGKLDVDRAELEVGRELVVELPLPGGRTPKPRPAKPRPPSELDRVREQLLSATKERRTLQAALDAATTRADELGRLRAELDGAREELESAAKARRGLEAALEEARAEAAELTRLRAELDRAREDAEQARADGERLVNDEYRQRERALQAAEEATARARKAEAAHGLCQPPAHRRPRSPREARATPRGREPRARRAPHRARLPHPGPRRRRRARRARAELEAREPEADLLAERDRLAAERDELQSRAPDPDLVAERDRLVAERDRLRAELEARAPDGDFVAQRDRLEGERDEARANGTGSRASATRRGASASGSSASATRRGPRATGSSGSATAHGPSATVLQASLQARFASAISSARTRRPPVRAANGSRPSWSRRAPTASTSSAS